MRRYDALDLWTGEGLHVGVLTQIARPKHLYRRLLLGWDCTVRGAIWSLDLLREEMHD